MSLVGAAVTGLVAAWFMAFKLSYGEGLGKGGGGLPFSARSEISR